MKNNYKYLLIYLVVICFYYFCFFIGSMDILPYSDETRPYFLPGIHFFSDGLYKIFTMEAFQYAFGHPPVFHLLIYIGKLLSFKDITFFRTYIYFINTLPLFAGLAFLIKTKAPQYILPLLPIVFFSHNEIFYYLHQFIPEVFSILFVLSLFYGIESKSRVIYYLSCIFLMLTREYSIIFIPVLLIQFLVYRKYYLTYFKIKDIFLGCLILALWFSLHKFHTDQFLGVFATLKGNFRFNIPYWLETIKFHIYHDITRFYWWFYVAISFITLALKRDRKIFLFLLTFVGFITGLSFYHISIGRYISIGFFFLGFATLYSITLYKNKYLKVLMILIVGYVSIYNVPFNSYSLENRYDGAKRVRDDYSVLNKYILPELNNHQQIYTDVLYSRICEVTNYFKGTYNKCGNILPLAYWEEGFKPKPNSLIIYRSFKEEASWSAHKFFSRWNWQKDLTQTKMISTEYYVLNYFLLEESEK